MKEYFCKCSYRHRTPNPVSVPCPCPGPGPGPIHTYTYRTPASASPGTTQTLIIMTLHKLHFNVNKETNIIISPPRARQSVSGCQKIPKTPSCRHAFTLPIHLATSPPHHPPPHNIFDPSQMSKCERKRGELFAAGERYFLWLELWRNFHATCNLLQSNGNLC